MTGLILASASPRRRELLGAVAPKFDVVPADVDESIEASVDGETAVRQLAERKAAKVFAQFADRPVLAADTLVELDEMLLGKPVDAAMARRYLRQLRGRTHNVLTGICLLSETGAARGVVIRSQVTIRRLAAEEIERTIALGMPFDKAGAYAIQDSDLRPALSTSGCICNIMGLPLWDVHVLLARSGIRLPLSAPSETLSRCVACPRRVVTDPA